jgi:hypothetical protein
MTRFGIIRKRHTRPLETNSTLKFSVAVQGAVFGTPDQHDQVPLLAIYRYMPGSTDSVRNAHPNSCMQLLGDRQRDSHMKWVRREDKQNTQSVSELFLSYLSGHARAVRVRRTLRRLLWPVG